METEEKAKVVASVWGTEFIHFLATLATYFASVDLEEKDEFNLLFLFHPSSMAYSDPLQSYVENLIIHYKHHTLTQGVHNSPLSTYSHENVFFNL